MSCKRFSKKSRCNHPNILPFNNLQNTSKSNKQNTNPTIPYVDCEYYSPCKQDPMSWRRGWRRTPPPSLPRRKHSSHNISPKNSAFKKSCRQYFSTFSDKDTPGSVLKLAWSFRIWHVSGNKRGDEVGDYVRISEVIWRQ